jgi:hypothetical protein
MRSGTGKSGHWLSVVGGAGLAISLWLPWYTINIPQSALNSVNQFSQQLGALGGLVRSGTALISQMGPFHFTAWEAMHTMPAVLLVVAIIGGGLALLAASDRAGSTSQLTMLAGAAGALLVGYRLLVPPWSNSFVSPDWGIYVGLLSSLAILAGGVLSGRESGAAESMLMGPGGNGPYTPAPAPAPYAPTPTGWGAAATSPAPSGWDTAAAPAMSLATDPLLGAPTAPTETWSSGGSVPPPAP